MDTICPELLECHCQEQCGTTMGHGCGTTMGHGCGPTGYGHGPIAGHVCGTTTGHGCSSGGLWWTRGATVVEPTEQGVQWDTVPLVLVDNLHPWTGPGQPGMAVVQLEFPALLVGHNVITQLPQIQAGTVKQQPRVMAAPAPCGRGSLPSGSEGRAPHGSPSWGQCQGSIPGVHPRNRAQPRCRKMAAEGRSRNGGGGA